MDAAASGVDRSSAAAYAALELRMVESEARAWRLLQAMDPVVVVDPEGIIELINVQAVVLFGYQPDELIGQPVERLIPSELHAAHRQQRLSYSTTEEPGPMSTGPNVVAVRKDGSTVPVEINLSAITLSSGRAVLASIRDVSDRKMSEAELRISDERFRVAFDLAPIGMALLDLHPPTVGRFLRVNRALCTLTGYSETALLATSSPAITHPGDEAATVSNLDRLANGAAARWDTDKRYRTASGADVWVHFVISVVHDASGIPSYGVSQVEDITDRKQAEAQLRERFHELTTNVDVGFLVRQLDPPEYVYFNPAYLKIFGLDPAGPPPTPMQAMAAVSPEDAERVGPVLATAAAGHRADAIWQFTRKDGESRWVSGRASPIIDADGQIRRVASLFEDITERKADEAALLAARAEAERANAAKTEFLSRMSHELRTPLNAVLGFGQLIEMDVECVDHRAWAQHILKAGKHLLGLIDEVLDITRLEAGAIRMSVEPVRVGDVIAESVDMLAPLADQRNIRMIIDKRVVETHVLADHQRFSQVVVNLLANAVKYNQHGGTVRISGETVNDVWFRLTITDTGIGIAEKDLPRLFRPFERLSAEGSDVEGTGLGLALTKRLIAEMGGEIGVRSSLGLGSSFWVELLTTEAPSGGRPKDPRLAIDSTSSPVRRTTLLYIEDNQLNVRLMEQIVTRRPHVDLLSATLGRTGLTMALTVQPDLILLDLHLPDISGEEVLRRLRAEPSTAGTPIVILSAEATMDQPKRLITLGATEYLTKPLRIPRILQLIDGIGETAAPLNTAG